MVCFSTLTAYYYCSHRAATLAGQCRQILFFTITVATCLPSGLCFCLPSFFVCFSFTTDDGPLFKKCALVSLCVCLSYFSPLSTLSPLIPFFLYVLISPFLTSLSLTSFSSSSSSVSSLSVVVYVICGLWPRHKSLTHPLCRTLVQRDLFVILCCLFCRHTASVEQFKIISHSLSDS